MDNCARRDSTTMERRSVWRWTRWLALLAAACVALTLTAYAVLSIKVGEFTLRNDRWTLFDAHFPDSPIAFDAEAWRANRAVPFISTEPRYRMAPMLVRDDSLRGTTRAEAFERLGPPDTTRDSQTSCIWLLRREPGYRAELLVVYFGARDRVERALQVRGEWY